MSGEDPLSTFCGSEFWNINVTWNTVNPDFTPCFERTVLVWIPCAFLWLFAPLETHYLIHSKNRLIPWSWINIVKIIGSLVIMIVECVNFFYIVSLDVNESIPGVFYLTPVLLFITVLLQLIFVLLGKRRGIQSSGVLFIFWVLMLICGAFAYRTYFLKNADEAIEVDENLFILYMIFYPVVAVMVFINLFCDARPQVLEYPRGEKSCPMEDSSFMRKIVFSWLDRLIWTGYRRPLTRDDLWDLTAENSAEKVVGEWNKNWKYSLAKTHKNGPSDTHASFSTDNATVEFMGTAPNKKYYVSILPTMIKTFGTTFLFGSLLKLVHDILQFTSPIILKLLISYSENVDNDIPEWRGYFYAVLLLIITQLQSFILGQYFTKMFLVGLRIRTGVISAVYRKALKLSNSARKESTVGEVVNLMSVDAQRFMDLTTYLNMIWSAPLQIALALYLIYNILGVAVFSGLAVMIVLIPINGFIASKIKKFQIKQMKCKDHRVKLMNEILNGIKVLKLYAWEKSFEKQVLEVRSEEVKVLKKAAYLNASTSFIWTCTPFLVSVASFAVFVMISEDPLDARTAFVSISLFNLLRFPIAMLPMLITNLVQASVSLKRLNKFLNSDELDVLAVSHDNTESDPVVIDNGTFAWGHGKEDKAILKNINLHVKSNRLVAVVGSVGSGKSSLCSAILGEMEKITGRVNVKGKVAYAPQQAWIQNATLVENILFGNPNKRKLYEKVIDACALRADLEMLPGGDQTEIGEKGINLSGGQKQRVSLARAVYSDADILIMDDPLSAVDSHVGKHIFEHVIGSRGLLKNKTRILVTHGIVYLPKVDHIVVLKDGVISEEGTYTELLQRKGEFQEFLLEHLVEGVEEEEELEALSTVRDDLERALGKEAFMRQISHFSQISHQKSESECSESVSRMSLSNAVGNAFHQVKKLSESEKQNTLPHSKQPSPEKGSKVADGDVVGKKLIEAEKAETGKVQVSVYGYYIKAVGVVAAILTIVFYVLSQACNVGASTWLSVWSEDENSTIPEVRNKYLGVYAAFGIGQAFAVILGAFVLYSGALEAGKILHAHCLNSVLHLPMQFFDTNPVGRILNRFSKDIDALDNILPWNLRSWLMCFVTVVATFVVIIASTPIFIVVMIPAVIIYYFIQNVYVATSRQLKRIESVSRSPIYSHFGESIQGASTIRAYGKYEEFILQSEEKVDNNQVSYFPSVMANRWLAIRLELIGNLMTFFAALFAVMERNDIPAGIVGLSISYAMSVTQTLNWLVRMTSDVETNVVSVERIKEYSETPQEAAWELSQNKPDKLWPEEGVIQFSKYATRYREGLDLVIKGIDCVINSEEKVGIVGRTGAGKSSLTLALFRIIEPAEGKIIIDGVDISKIGLHDLRGRLTIIPQDPVLFSGTLRMNLDPFNVCSDDSIWISLEHAHLKGFVSELPSQLQHEIAEGGENLSVGQRQLVCLARALLRKTKVLILDEATAAVDLETDMLIQDTIRTEFRDCTVITIAHRINTIMDANRVIVMDKGAIVEYDAPDVLLKSPNSIFYRMAKDAGLV